ncbi:hypothetical protein ACH5RR_009209 [Cinchona calisaya]|uniref:Uncharacterized protein n=1 Tax=Cinchona calisaya TaxID=153742 RepID=A0ABD3ADS6_9GENT
MLHWESFIEGKKIDDYCDAAFTKECYQKTYTGMINPVSHEENWLELPNVILTTLLPPPLSTTFKCSICQSYGHNKRTCQRCPVRAKKGSNTGDQMATRREKLGRGMASTGLSGAVLWDHASGNVPVIFSSQGHNPIPNVLGGQTQTNAANVQTNVQIQFQASTSDRSTWLPTISDELKHSMINKETYFKNQSLDFEKLNTEKSCDEELQVGRAKSMFSSTFTNASIEDRDDHDQMHKEKWEFLEQKVVKNSNFQLVKEEK